MVTDGADPVSIINLSYFKYFLFFMNNNVPVPVICSLAGIYFPTPLGRSLNHSLAFKRFQISASGNFSGFSSGGCLPDAGGGSTRDEI